jgi:hypothetical protein
VTGRARSLLLGLALWLAAAPALAQSGPGFPTTFGYVPTPAQWQAAFTGKQDVLAAPPLLTTGGTMTGPLVTVASTTLNSGFNVPPGVAPTSPINGDVWTTAAGLFVRANGSTVGPLISAGGAVTFTSLAINGCTIGANNFCVNGFSFFNSAISVATVNVNGLAVGPGGATNPSFNVDASTASAVAGLNVKGGVTGGNVGISVTDSGPNAGLTIDAKGSGSINLGSVSTGNIILSRAVTAAGTITAASKGHILGTFGGTAATGAVTTADSSIQFYNVSSTNWAGVGADNSGNLWFRVGTSGTPAPAMYIDTSQVAHFVGNGVVIQATNVNAFAVGPSGTTLPALNVDTTTASSVTGLNVKSAAAGSGLAVSVISSGTNEGLSVNTKGSGTLNLQNVGTGGIVVGGATGGDKGAGTLNLSGNIFVNGVALAGSGTVTSVVAGTGLSGGTITTSGTIAVNYAAKSDQQTGTSTILAVNPSIQQQHDSAAKAWISFVGSTAAVRGSYNATVSRTSAGLYTVSFTTAFASANYACHASSETVPIAFFNAAGRAAGSIVLNTITTGGTNSDASIVDVACYGRQ